jgi:predicted nucleotidyltransferase
MKKINVDINVKQISDFCRKWEISNLALFGSVLTDEFSPDSDIDVLVTFASDAKRTLFDLVRMKGELEEIFNRSVDIVSRRGIESSRNLLRREEILFSAEDIYVA